MLRSNIVVFFLFACLVCLLPLACLAEPTRTSLEGSRELLAESPFAAATFSYAGEPEKTLVFVSSTGMSMQQKTIALYGDGRLAFRTVRAQRVTEEQIVTLDDREIRQVLRLVVDFGLAEWDMTRVQSKQLEKNNGRLYGAVPSDATQTTILISLDDYERGDYKVPHLERKVRFLGASFADRLYPPILEIRGILELKHALHRLKDEKKGAEP